MSSITDIAVILMGVMFIYQILRVLASARIFKSDHRTEVFIKFRRHCVVRGI